MKINLSKEHIEKGCELVEDYEWYQNALCYSTLMETSGIGDCEPLYRDFLQLVIEGINRSNEKNRVYIRIVQFGGQILVANGYNEECFTHCGIALGIIQAKEKAIAYVFDNMKVKE